MNLFIGLGIILLGMADAYTTSLALSRGASEANPIVLWLMDKLPGDMWVAVKLGVHLIVGMMVVFTSSISTLLQWAGVSVLIWYSYVVINNLLVIGVWI